MSEAKPASGIPLPDAIAGNFQEAVRWFNQMWGLAGDAAGAGRAGGPIPSALMPTLDINEIDKRIGDLRSVEHWLQLNQGLLQTTIQGLEMQRNTLAAWQSFGAAATAAAGTGAASGPAASTVGGEIPAFQPTLWWSALQQQFAQMAAAAAPNAAPADAGTASPGQAAPADAAGAGAEQAAPSVRTRRTPPRTGGGGGKQDIAGT